MNSISQKYKEIQDALDLNQQEYKAKQNDLLQQLEDLQKHCPHDRTNRFLIGEELCVKCQDCAKIYSWQKKEPKESEDNPEIRTNVEGNE